MNIKKERNQRELVSVLLIIIFAFLIRLFLFKISFSFTSELANDLLDFKNAYLEKRVLLLGPHSGTHPWLYFSPLYYWLFIPVVRIFGFNPEVFGFFSIFVGTSIVLLNYLVTRRVFSEKFSVISSILIAASPLWIDFSKDARFYSLVLIFFYPFIYFLFRFWNGDKKYLYLASLVFATMVTLHYSSLILLPSFLLIIYLKRKAIFMKDLLAVFLAFLVPFLPFILYHGYGLNMMLNLLSWPFYRFAGFVGLYPKNNFSPNSFFMSMAGINEFIGRQFTFNNRFFSLFSLFFLVSVVVKTIDFFKKKAKKYIDIFGLTAFYFGVSAILIHGGFIPFHYLLGLAPFVIFWASEVLLRLIFLKRPLINFLIISLALFLFVINVNNINKMEDFNRRGIASLSPHFMPLNLQKDIVKYIIDDSKQRKISISRVGPFDYYPYDYSQNYRYLLWLYGKEPETGPADLTYIIYEDTTKLPKGLGKIHFISNIAILKKTNY